MKAPQATEYITLDALAECYPVSEELYGKLWNDLLEDGVDLSVADRWSCFTEEEQVAICAAIIKEDGEL